MIRPAPVKKKQGHPVERLVDSARKNGLADNYMGKRQGTRFKAQSRLEVTTDLKNHVAQFPAVMHNVSEGGCAFWAKYEFEGGTRLFVRAFSPASPETWIPARVRHCTKGIQGVLTGILFEDVPPPKK